LSLRRLAVAAVLAAVAAAPAAAATLDEIVAGLNLVPLRGGASPGLALERLADGKRVTLSALRGRPVLVYFWATW
jgi:cytochrome oxidase Cu insertion factor (SCO1/SenC/PrrC family)